MPIISAEEYELAVFRLEKLTDAAPGTEEAKELKVLTRLIAAFEYNRLPTSPD
ncbi:hypothetical protein ACFS7Z_20025 [Pontibacter toksunensis]|uniref:HTH-type transcriptional regulator / antitoxin HigA n=2 Tax=Pontibacter toksunensis TaxID=1332631 RepID=A0ABW6BXX0_9BACT